MIEVDPRLRAVYPDFPWNSDWGNHKDCLALQIQKYVEAGGRFHPELCDPPATGASYKQSLQFAMEHFARDPLARFVGYGLLDGKGGCGTMKNIPNDKIVEMPVAENLMVGVAHGLALTGLRPLVYFERADFVAEAVSAIANHLDCAREISRGVFNPCVIIRATIGNSRKPLFTGPTHTSNPTHALKQYLHMPVYEVKTPEEVTAAYERAIYEQAQGIGSSLILEHKDLI